jgi:hypothetical protein
LSTPPHECGRFSRLAGEALSEQRYPRLPDLLPERESPMSSAIDRNYMSPRQPRDRHTRHRVFHRGVLIWVVLALLLATAVPTAFYVFAHVAPGASTRASSSASAPSLSASPADRFIQSIVTQDGALGWHQLCPSIQADIPLDELKQQADAQRLTMAQQGVWLTAKPMGTRPQADGGVSHMYLVTAHSRSGTTQSLTFIVFTQRSGCVEDVHS